MERKPLKLHFSILAKKDIQDIYDYSFFRFGEKQTLAYLDLIDKEIDMLRVHPEIGVERNDISKKLFSLVCESHIIFFTYTSQQLTIVRILHQKRNFDKQFK